MNANQNLQEDVQDLKVDKGINGEGLQAYQTMDDQKQGTLNISKSITIKHSESGSGSKPKTQQDSKQQQIKTQNQSSDLLQKLIQKLSQKQNRRDQNLQQLNQNMNKLVKLFVEKWTQPEMDHQRSIRQKNNKEASSNQNIYIQQEYKVNQDIIIKKINLQENEACKKTQLNSCEYPPQFQSKLKEISVKIPQKSSSRNEILGWVGNMCKKVLSDGFKRYKNNELDIRKVKLFCSQNILRNLILLPKQIKKQHWSAIDNCLKNELIPYFRLNYSETNEENRISKLSEILVEKDIFNENQNKNDLVLLSGVKFYIQEDENYNPQIMQLLNYVISLPRMLPGLIENIQNDKNSLNKLFKNDMEKFFQFIELKQNVEEVKNFNPLNPKHKIFDHHIKQYINKNFIIHEEQDKFKEQKNEQGQPSMNKSYSNNQSVKYKEKVKSFTSQQIGQKIPQNTELFSISQIQNGNLKLKNISLMKIVKKWCQQLQKYFNPQEILERQNPWKMKDGSEGYLQKNQMVTLNILLQREKQVINKKLKQIRKNKYDNQIQFSNREIDQQLKRFSEEEATVGQFCSSVFKINETYLIRYLNLLIHGINVALKDFQKIQKVDRYLYQFQVFQKNQEQILNFLQRYFGQQNEPKNKIKAISQTPQLITFKIEDLLRCKCISKESEIRALYKFIQYLSHTQPQFIKILRVKNNINRGSNDIIINILYRSSIIIEMELAIKSENSKLIQYQNKFNHYLYQLEMARFGPIMEMCNIWSSYDKRSTFYLQRIQENNKRIKHHDQARKLRQCCLKSSNKHITLPLKCQVCCYTYYGYNFYQKHSKCQQYNIYICFLCQFEESDQKNKEQIFPNLKQYSYLISEDLKTSDKLPINGGFLININSKQKKMKFFKPIIYKKQCYLLNYVQHKNNEILQILDKFIFKQNRQEDGEQQKKRFEEQLQEWFEKLSIFNLIFECNEIQKKYKELDSKTLEKQYFLSKYFCYLQKLQKKSVTLQEKYLTNNTFQQIPSPLTSIQKINLPKNKLSQIKILNQKFPNTQLAILNNNNFSNIKIQDISNWSNWSNSLTYLNLSKNNLEKVQGISILKKLIKLDLSENQIIQIPDQIFIQFKLLESINVKNNQIEILLKKDKQEEIDLPNLKSLNISENHLQYLPESIGNLKNLTFLDISSNQLSSLPESIGNLQKLTKFNFLNKNLQSLPQSLGNLKNLTYLNLKHYNLRALPQSFGNIENLTQLIIQTTKIQYLPDSFGNLINLTSLDIKNNNYLNQLPQSFGNLENLTSLNLNDNFILYHLPQTFGNLKNLKKLFIDKNLCSLPESFGNLENLTQLIIINTSLSSLPESFGNLKNIVKLRLSENQLSSLPESFGNLVNLTQLQIKNNKLSTLPQSFGNLINLTKFIIFNNQLSTLPESFGNLKNLTQLKICSNQLYKLPQSFGNLVNLPILQLQNNNLTSLPNSIGNLKKLTHINIYNNKLLSLPDSFGDLHNLTSLLIYNNQISTLPESFGNLQNLTQLKIYSNWLQKLPESFGNLKNLTTLIISYNQLSSLPQSFGNLQNLTTLQIQKNKLTTLPKSFGNLSKLTQLTIFSNNLTHLPNQLINLKNLKYLQIYNTNFQEMPACIFKLQSLQRLSISDETFNSVLPEIINNKINLKELYLEFENQEDVENSLIYNLFWEVCKNKKMYFAYKIHLGQFQIIQNQYEKYQPIYE